MIPGCQTCGAAAVVLFPGDEGATTLFHMGVVRKIDDFDPRPPVDGFGPCLPHAREHGWPNYPSQHQPVRRTTAKATA